MAANDLDSRLQRRIEAEVRRFLREQALPLSGTVVVAVSGGADSSALLLILHRLVAKTDVRLVVAHFDHGLRGEAVGRAEADFARGLAGSLALPFIEGRGEVRRRAAKDREGIEAAARRERYAFLGRVAREQGATAVATGHTATDQAETVLLHLMRGSGLAGLGGMAPVAGWPFGEGPALLRPLLGLTAEDTRAYCRAAGIEPVVDESNESAQYRRNRVRNELLPLLRELNPAVETALLRLADAARSDAALIDSLAAALVMDDETHVAAGDSQSPFSLERTPVRTSHPNPVRLDRAAFVAAPEALRRHALRLALSRLLGDAGGFSARHLLAVERLATGGRTGDRLDLPRGLVAALDRDVLRLSASTGAPEALPETPVTLPVPSEVRFGRLLVTAGAARSGGVAVEADAAAVGDTLCVRRRRPGDRMQPAGLDGTKKLQDLFVDAHVARAERDAVPVFANERGIVWVGGLRLAAWVRPQPGAPTVWLSYR